MAQTKAFLAVATANVKELTQHDSMGDWQDFRGGSKQQRKLAAASGKSGPTMPKMGDRFLKRPSDDEVRSKVERLGKGVRRQRQSASDYSKADQGREGSEGGEGRDDTNAARPSKKEHGMVTDVDTHGPALKKQKVVSSSSSTLTGTSGAKAMIAHASNHFDQAQAALARATNDSSGGNCNGTGSLRGHGHYANAANAGGSSVWHVTIDKVSNKKYWYNALGETSWTNPAAPAARSGTGNTATSSSWVAISKKKKKKKNRSVDIAPLM